MTAAKERWLQRAKDHRAEAERYKSLANAEETEAERLEDEAEDMP